MKNLILCVGLCLAPLVGGCVAPIYYDQVPVYRQNVVVVPEYYHPPARHKRRTYKVPDVEISIRRKSPEHYYEEYPPRGQYDRRGRHEHYAPHYDPRGDYLYHRRPYWWE